MIASMGALYQEYLTVRGRRDVCFCLPACDQTPDCDFIPNIVHRTHTPAPEMHNPQGEGPIEQLLNVRKQASKQASTRMPDLT
jgi:hypothetical protein